MRINCKHMMIDKTPILIELSVYLYIITIAINNAVSLSLFRQGQSLAQISGLILAFFYLFFFGSEVFKSFRHFSKSSKNCLLFLLSMVLIEYLRFIVNPSGDFALSIRQINRDMQLLISFYILCDLMVRDTRLIKRIIIFIMTLYSIITISVFFEITPLLDVSSGRYSTIGSDPNGMAYRSSYMLILFLGILLYKKPKNNLYYIGLLLLLGVTFISLLKTGSRSGLIVFIIGTLVLMVIGIDQRKIFVYLTIIPIVMYSLYNIYDNGSYSAKRRFDRTFNSEDDFLKDRRMIIQYANYDLIKDKLFIGYGSSYNYVLGQYLNTIRKSPHNAYAEILLIAGILPLFFYLSALYNAIKKIFFYRSLLIGNIMLAINITFLIALFFGNYYNKENWLLIAILANSQLVVRSFELH